MDMLLRVDYRQWNYVDLEGDVCGDRKIAIYTNLQSPFPLGARWLRKSNNRSQWFGNKSLAHSFIAV